MPTRDFQEWRLICLRKEQLTPTRKSRVAHVGDVTAPSLAQRTHSSEERDGDGLGGFIDRHQWTLAASERATDRWKTQGVGRTLKQHTPTAIRYVFSTKHYCLLVRISDTESSLIALSTVWIRPLRGVPSLRS